MRFICSRGLSRQRLDGFLVGPSQRHVWSSIECLFRPNRAFTPPTRQFTISYPKSESAADARQKSRIDAVKGTFSDPYPRFKADPRALTCDEFRAKYERLTNNETVDDLVMIYGRVRSQRIAGSKLIFFDVWRDNTKVQALFNQRILLEHAGVTPEKFKEIYHAVGRGDVCCIVGKPHRTGRGELSISATELPQLMSPCLHDVPVDAKNHEISPYERHVQFLSNPWAADVLRARATVIQSIRNFFVDRKFTEVETPVLASAVGGASAQPFVTSATEFPERPLAMRIAPELWLKRLVVGGFDRVFEIGPQFRNEGLDRTHNPEFTTCEFYQAYTDLETLMGMTESLFRQTSENIKVLNKELGTLKPTDAEFDTQFHRIDFVPALEEVLGERLPDLTAEDAATRLCDIFESRSTPLPAQSTLPHLLDKLSSEYLEPQCTRPTYIINHPECMSPLAKSFEHPTCKQTVSARAELFVDGREMVNMYEEENSPDEQRRKFHEQQTRHGSSEAGDGNGNGNKRDIDESYVQALQWGLPPTGGWGCGIDRLVMLFTGARRIGDVLSFGNLRSVARPSVPEPEGQEVGGDPSSRT